MMKIKVEAIKRVKETGSVDRKIRCSFTEEFLNGKHSQTFDFILNEDQVCDLIFQSQKALKKIEDIEVYTEPIIK